MSRGTPLKASLLLIALLPTLPAQAWVRVAPELDENPLIGTTYYGVLSTLVPILTTTKPGEGTELAEEISKESSSIDQKLKLARDGAAAFVGSHGQIRGVMLEAALVALQQRTELASYSDMQLAEAVLAYEPRSTR
ncbi:uncharacterized protein (TIGR02448 family) [Pseudomonas sp. BIGb0408]|uniref:Uncharacterized protein (TIGR02448 family) n=1 Tax=Phytopseudomonas flavescens TaxID=29435 RepID=A0A7Y9XT51_9GAMM|nr:MULTISPECIES: DUF2388 domain-containing protein [Pseudomonas]MCW2294997.1 uncharacterized protein (TIGR02448 family) [Pseudomonas sp. BIGb0408]NYH75729.1 uncharacterized protein (TIGR02448 family) [Pseudomonas flavescens]